MAMTVKEALISDVSYPLPDAFFEKTFIARGLKGDDAFTQEIGVSRPFRLAYADCLKRHATAVGFSEPGLSVSLDDKKTLISMANSIYSEYGEPLVETEAVATATYIGESWNEDW